MFKISADWLEALSVVAATALAGVALWKQWKDEAARRKSVDATISADAYAVRRTLRAWVTSAQHIEAASWDEGQGPYGLVLGQQDKPVEERLARAVAAAPLASRLRAVLSRD